LTLVDAEGEHGGSGDEAEAAADGEQAADSGGVTVENAATQDDVDSANREIFVTAGTTGTGLPLATARPWSADPAPPPVKVWQPPPSPSDSPCDGGGGPGLFAWLADPRDAFE
jgi:hypothetical protein